MCLRLLRTVCGGRDLVAVRARVCSLTARADVGHPGKNNQFLVSTGHRIAIEYNDSSVRGVQRGGIVDSRVCVFYLAVRSDAQVLENFHVAKLFLLCEEPDLDILQQLLPAAYADLRKMAIDFVMATDLAKQKAMCEEFKTTFAPKSACARGRRRTLCHRPNDCRLCTDCCGPCVYQHTPRMVSRATAACPYACAPPQPRLRRRHSAGRCCGRRSCART